MAKAASTKKATAQTKPEPAKAETKPAPVKKAPTAPSFDDPYTTPAFKKALRTNHVKHKRVYEGVNSLDIENKTEILAAISAAHKAAKKKLFAEVDKINAPAEAVSTPAGDDDLG